MNLWMTMPFSASNRNRIQQLEDELHDYQVGLGTFKDKIDQLKPKVESSAQHMEGFKETVAQERNRLGKILRKLLM
jgi:SMC interacting uncharacterized protein involved in chromosome segregation